MPPCHITGGPSGTAHTYIDLDPGLATNKQDFNQVRREGLL